MRVLFAFLLLLTIQVPNAVAANAPALSETRLNNILSVNRSELQSGSVIIISEGAKKYYCVLSTSLNPFKDSETKLHKSLDSKGKITLYKYIKKNDPSITEIALSRWQSSRALLGVDKFQSLGCVAVDSVRKVYATKKIQKEDDSEILSETTNKKQFQLDEAELSTGIKNNKDNLLFLQELLDLYKSQGDVTKSNAIQSQIMRIEFKNME